MEFTARQVRCLLLCRQGLGHSPIGRSGPKQLDQLITQLGFVQLDSIAAVERAHHLTLRSRLPSYKQQHLRELLERTRSVFEHWTHDASAIPTTWRHHWKHRFDRYAVSDRAHPWWSKNMGNHPDKVIRHVLARIRHEGPLRCRDFEDDRSAQGGWWDWKPAKAALEYLWRSGRISVTGRSGFQKIYDLSSRVHPETPRKSSAKQHLNWACSEALDRLGVATAAELAAFFRAVTVAAARGWIQENIDLGTLVSIAVLPIDGGKPVRSVARATIASDISECSAAPLLGAQSKMRLLCPFDPVIRDRKRLARLFGFEYRFEAFVPKSNRRYGYYVLPILQGDRLIGRVDLKTDRSRDRLLIKGIWWEPSIKPTAALRRILNEELKSLANFVGVSSL
ncbi:MAG: crosslink repair DNA glycosylase YcaQ family protein [Phycisphaerales bacterium]|jgi:hypothetical protein|nr:crosslink repair DNA glycosylase YcaQ family protein [Phycisphaerales bacterium]